MKNIVYVGALAALLDIDLEVIHGIIREKFARKPKLLDSNFLAVRLGYEYAREHFACPLPIRLQRMDATGGMCCWTATPPPRWAASTPAPRWGPGTRSPPRPR
jgi:hypothetical protein